MDIKHYALNMRSFGQKTNARGREKEKKETDQTCCKRKEVEEDLQHVSLDQYISVL